MRVLFTSPILEHPPAGGPQLRIANTIKALSQVCELDIISRAPPLSNSGQDYFRDYCGEFDVSPVARTISDNRYIRKLQEILGQIGQRAIRRDAEYILAHIQRRGIDTIWFGFGNISYPLIAHMKKCRPDLRMICDTDSVWSRFILRRLPYTHGLRKRLTRRAGQKKELEERAWVNLCDVTTAVSEVDADYYRSLATDPRRIFIFSNVIDIAAYDGEAPLPPEGLRHPAIYLAGTFGQYHSPMDTAARWTINEVMPLVRQQIADVQLYLVGANSDRMFGHIADPAVTVTGKLPSVLPYLRNIDVALVPLKFESGTRFKILEAGACRVPLVSTTLGAEGIPVQHGRDILIADEPQTFANAIVRLLTDKALAGKIANNCSDLVRQHYSVEALRDEARRILAYLGPHQQMPS